MTKAQASRRLRIPMRFVDGHWECAFGGTVPVKEGSQAQFVIDRASISDQRFLQTLERKERHKVLDEGTALLVWLTIKPENPPPEALRPLLIPFRRFQGTIGTSDLDRWNPVTAAFIEVRLGGPDSKQGRLFKTDRGGLWLITEGVEAVGLNSTTILLPNQISEKSVASLNHAYTKLSEIFETWRISHTGNIYSQVLYQEKSGTWYPLDILRGRTLAAKEQEIAWSLWATIRQRMLPAAPSGE